MSGKEFEDYGTRRATFEPTVSSAAGSESPPWPNYYSANHLDRSGKERLYDDAAFAEAVSSERARIAVVYRGRNLVRLAAAGGGLFEALFLSSPEAAAMLADPGSATIFLGSSRSGASPGLDYFACDVSHLEEYAPPSGGAFQQLRSVGGALSRDEDAGLFAAARGMGVWHRAARFCQSCGGSMKSTKAGNARACGACGKGAYPRIDPSVIVLVTSKGGGHALLGRKANWPGKRYSTLAGFCEVGETLEETVVREVFEESGVRVSAASIRYASSQTWPFPRSLMVAFVAEAEEIGLAAVLIPEEEMEDVRWFSRQEVRDGLATEELSIPGRAAVAHHLITSWLDA